MYLCCERKRVWPNWRFSALTWSLHLLLILLTSPLYHSHPHISELWQNEMQCFLHTWHELWCGWLAPVNAPQIPPSPQTCISIPFDCSSIHTPLTSVFPSRKQNRLVNVSERSRSCATTANANRSPRMMYTAVNPIQAHKGSRDVLPLWYQTRRKLLQITSF